MSPPRHLHPVASGSSLSCCPDSDSPVLGASKKPEAMTASCSPRVLWKHYQFSVRWHKRALEALQSSLRNSPDCLQHKTGQDQASTTFLTTLRFGTLEAAELFTFSPRPQATLEAQCPSLSSLKLQLSLSPVQPSLYQKVLNFS